MAFRSNLHFAESPRHSPTPPVSLVRQQLFSGEHCCWPRRDRGDRPVKARLCGGIRAHHHAAAYAPDNDFGKTAVPLSRSISCCFLAERFGEVASRARRRYARLHGPGPKRRHAAQADSDDEDSNEKSANLASRSTPFAARRNERTRPVSSIEGANASGVSWTDAGEGLFNLLRSVVVAAEIAIADDAHGDA